MGHISLKWWVGLLKSGRTINRRELPSKANSDSYDNTDPTMESVINEIEFDFDQTVSIRTDVKLSKEDVKQIVSEAPEETLEEIVYQSLVTDELYLRARAKEIVAKLKQEDLEVKRIEYWNDEGHKV